MYSSNYNQLLKFLYFEGYADSYAEAEELLESMTDEEFQQLVERRLNEDDTLRELQRRFQRRKEVAKKAKAPENITQGVETFEKLRARLERRRKAAAARREKITN